MPHVNELETVESAVRCYCCGSPLGAGSPDVCVDCGRAQSRTCFCGAQIPRALAVCPQCGTDWSHIRRLRRTSTDERRARRWRAGIVGGAIALGLAGLAYVGWQLAEAQSDAAWTALRSLGVAVAGAFGTVGPLVLVFAIGALGGLAVHHLRHERRRSLRRRSRAPR